VAVALPLPRPRGFLVGAAASAEGESWCFEAPAADVSGILTVGVVMERIDGWAEWRGRMEAMDGWEVWAGRTVVMEGLMFDV
jgi:hypothetical protein